MTSEIRARAWARVAAGSFFVAAFLGLAVAGVHPPQSTTRSTAQAPAASRWVPPGMHEAQAGVDVGPGADEGFLASSPQPE